MMHGPVARADLDPVRRGQRVRHVGLGHTHRLGKRQSLGKAGRYR